ELRCARGWWSPGELLRRHELGGVPVRGPLAGRRELLMRRLRAGVTAGRLRERTRLARALERPARVPALLPVAVLRAVTAGPESALLPVAVLRPEPVLRSVPVLRAVAAGPESALLPVAVLWCG